MAAQPAPITPEEAEARGHSRPQSGFARPGYWDEIDPDYKAELADQIGPEYAQMTRRERQSIWAKRRIQEGKFGGRPGQGGRPRIKTATEIVAEAARDRADRIVNTLFGLLGDKNPHVRLGAIDRLMASDQYVDRTRREDEKMLASLSGDELDNYFLRLVQEVAYGGVDIEGELVEDADVVEDEAAHDANMELMRGYGAE